MNKLAIFAASANIPADEQQQFAQLIGYSVSGYGDLSYVTLTNIRKADRRAAKVAP